MSEHTLQALLAQMKDQPVTLGWGAIAAFSRNRLNDLLRHQYVAGLNDFRLMQPLSIELSLTDEENMFATFTNVVFGAPQVSFASSALPGSSVSLAISIIAGSFSLVSRASVGPPRLVSCFDFSEEEGFNLSMQLDMATLLGEVDRSARFALDLEKGEQPTCNALPEWPAQQRMGEALFAYIKAQPRNIRVFQMGLVDLNGYNPLSPRAFHLYTQAAPGATDGDGALLLFTRLKGLDENGREPVLGSDFPYLIPSDRNGDGPLYTASLALNADLRKWVEERPLDVTESMAFPARNLFVEEAGGRHEPHDLLVLGNIRGAEQSATVQPLVSSLKAGGQRQFEVRRADGSLVSGVQWSTYSLGSQLSSGSISANGLYSAPTVERLGQDSQPSMVIARYTLDGRMQESSAMVLDRCESMSVQPRARSLSPGGEAVDIRVSSLGGGELQWRLLEPGLGSLEVKGAGHAVYTPPDTVEPLVSLQKIECRDALSGETIESAMVIVSATPGAEVDPPYVPSIAQGASVQFFTNVPPEYAHWSVIGEGSISEDGVFTPPAEVTSLISLVLCDFMLDNGTSMATGYATVQMSRREDKPHWSALDSFAIEAPGSLNQCYANGYQQIPLLITVKTQPVDGQDVPLEPCELATMQIVDGLTDLPLPFLDDEQEGIEYGSGIPYAVLKHRNRFDLYDANRANGQAPAELPAPRDESVRRHMLYVHITAQGPRRFYAQFQDMFGGIWKSDAFLSEGDIYLTGERLPNPDSVNDYELVRERAFSDSGYTGPDGTDEFNYIMKSVDYWTVLYRRMGIYQIPFATMFIEANCSTIQWESEQIDELFFSFTGHAFYPAVYGEHDKPPARLTFDPYYRLLHQQQGGLPIREEFESVLYRPAPGELMISLHRVDDMTFWYDEMAYGDKDRMYRQLLDQPLIFVLIDMEGNRHRLAVGFPSPTQDDSRNTLMINRQ